MAEQKCIICGNIVRFNRGERVGVCEFCETKQEYAGFVEPVTEPDVEPIISTVVTTSTSTLTRAKKLDLAEVARKKEETEIEERKMKRTLIITGLVVLAICVICALMTFE